ncbi:hypothetical protein [Bradyrhizobium sp. CCBAU 25338]|uniref:hypothetical protein n=1 Tax=Bradyrhizobium sp. CCBAU 25338 TaxID=1641877 RepID=UPI002FE1835D
MSAALWWPATTIDQAACTRYLPQTIRQRDRRAPRSQSKDNKMRTNDHRTARAMREANKQFKQVDSTKQPSDYEIAQQSFQDNRERLKAERLAREAKSTGRRE